MDPDLGLRKTSLHLDRLSVRVVGLLLELLLQEGVGLRLLGSHGAGLTNKEKEAFQHRIGFFRLSGSGLNRIRPFFA